MKKKKDTQPLTTVQQLGSLIKSARDIMRKDKGLSGDLEQIHECTRYLFMS
jgi:type I restriction enzyme M protein